MKTGTTIDLQTQAMLNMADDDVIVSVGQHKDTLKWHGLLYGNHPTPSGSPRYMLLLSDNRGWDDKETAEQEFRKSLKKSNIATGEGDE